MLATNRHSESEAKICASENFFPILFNGCKLIVVKSKQKLFII